MLRNKKKKQSASVLVSKLLEDITLDDAPAVEDENKIDRKNFKAWMNNSKPRKGMGVSGLAKKKKNLDQPIDTRCLLST